MRLALPLSKVGFGYRVAVLVPVAALVNYALNGQGTSAWLRDVLANRLDGTTPGEVAYLVFILQSLLTGLFLLALTWAVMCLERPAHVGPFFKLGPIDWAGLGMIAGLTILLNVLEGAFLRRLVYEPVRVFLNSIGVWGHPALDAGFTPDPRLAALNFLLLLLILWIEAPEEVIFRGYIQNHLQDRIGPNAALFAGALTWTLWHSTAPAEYVRILVYGLALSLVFRLRQNTTPLAVWHPLGNRLLLMIAMAGALLGRA